MGPTEANVSLGVAKKKSETENGPVLEGPQQQTEKPTVHQGRTGEGRTARAKEGGGRKTTPTKRKKKPPLERRTSTNYEKSERKEPKGEAEEQGDGGGLKGPITKLR